MPPESVEEAASIQKVIKRCFHRLYARFEILIRERILPSKTRKGILPPISLVLLILNSTSVQTNLRLKVYGPLSDPPIAQLDYQNFETMKLVATYKKFRALRTHQLPGDPFLQGEEKKILTSGDEKFGLRPQGCDEAEEKHDHGSTSRF
ncbi:hypothetical protein JOM56_001755 [Amanita muscaria]